MNRSWYHHFLILGLGALLGWSGCFLISTREQPLLPTKTMHRTPLPMVAVATKPAVKQESSIPSVTPDPGGLAGTSKQGEITLPISVLDLVSVNLCNLNNGEINEDVLNALELTVEQSGFLKTEVASVLEKIKQLEIQNAHIQTTSDGGQFITVKPFAEGKDLINNIKGKLDSRLGDNKSKFIMDILERDGYFAFFGKFPQEISITERNLTHIGKGIQTMVETKFSHNQANLSHGYSTTFSMESLSARYGQLYRSLGLLPN